MMRENERSAVVTTARKWNDQTIALARGTAAKLGLAYVPRQRLSIEEVRERWHTDMVLVAKQDMLVLETPAGELFFHPNMAHLRLKNIRKGDGDRMAEAMDLRPGMSVLDCTLGFGADSIVASFVVGPEGCVTGIESQPLVEAVVSCGLHHFSGDTVCIREAMRRIRTVCDDSLHYLKNQPDRSVDIVYFDPMFRHPLMDSTSLDPLRTVANHHALTPEHIAEARRVARRRVVFKETSRSMEFSRLGFTKIEGGRYSKVHYGVMILD
ncbi:MAG: class I SAM-dependent methyltransferase [Selenomonas montiformis]|nr:class I SAM-dependent methyltransferase [Selenomonas montiformis]